MSGREEDTQYALRSELVEDIVALLKNEVHVHLQALVDELLVHRDSLIAFSLSEWCVGDVIFCIHGVQKRKCVEQDPRLCSPTSGLQFGSYCGFVLVPLCRLPIAIRSLLSFGWVATRSECPCRCMRSKELGCARVWRRRLLSLVWFYFKAQPPSLEILRITSHWCARNPSSSTSLESRSRIASPASISPPANPYCSSLACLVRTKFGWVAYVLCLFSVFRRFNAQFRAKLTSVRPSRPFFQLFTPSPLLSSSLLDLAP